jgi:hypothetical protein
MTVQQNNNSVETSLYRGQVVYIYAFDIAYDMKRQPLTELLGQPIQDYSIGPNKRSPKQLFFYRPQMITLPHQERQINNKTVLVQRHIKIFNVGAISIQIRVPFEVQKIEDLVSYHDIRLNGNSLEEEMMQLAQQAWDELKPYCIRPVPQLKQIEDYTVFCLDALPHIDGCSTAEDWLKINKRWVAGLLTQEQDIENLSEQEAVESTEQYVTYYSNDLAVIDWDAALVVGEQESLNEILHIMELANVQLVELAAYDRILDGSLEASYRDLTQRTHVSRQLQRNLREIRIDTARLSDELSNITKFFGDWYLASIYRKISSRFHLNDWHAIIKEKLKTLADLYQILQQDWVNYLMMILEITIVLLFVIDLVLLFVTAH